MLYMCLYVCCAVLCHGCAVALCHICIINSIWAHFQISICMLFFIWPLHLFSLHFPQIHYPFEWKLRTTCYILIFSFPFKWHILTSFFVTTLRFFFRIQVKVYEMKKKPYTINKLYFFSCCFCCCFQNFFFSIFGDIFCLNHKYNFNQIYDMRNFFLWMQKHLANKFLVALICLHFST